MIVDSSAIVAIVFEEPGFDRLLDAIRESGACGVPAPVLVEAGIVVSARLGRDASGLLSRLITQLDVAVIPFGQEHAREAVAAWVRFGKGRHPAALNFGDCISYAVAKLARAQLLCTGRDFARTDIALA